ncbi:MAG: prephenate dehydratase [Bacteroidales bacterium]|nr:prephenate dehydratase [Bacteroidales bacterium]
MTKHDQKLKRIAIQGGFGAFHELAAHHYFEGEEIEIMPRDTFRDMMKSLKERQVDYAIMAIENSLAGSILPNYSLIKGSKMKIIGEIYIRIKQNLVALPGQKIEDIQEVFSHPMAILQCQDFFDQYPKIKLIESLDTALSAKEIRDNNLSRIGAIASTQAAKNFDLDILAGGIETNKMNYTRFLLLKEENGEELPLEGVNKTSIQFAVSHKSGSLTKVLSVLSYYDQNLTKIQSMPIVGKEWEYQFYVDLMFDDLNWHKKAIEAIRPFTSELEILGIYIKGKSIIET